MDLLKILEGFRNDLLPKKELKELIEQVSEERLAICKTCPWNSENIDGSSTFRKCTACGCFLKQKSKCLSCNCGLEVYNIKEGTNHPLKWTAVLTGSEEESIDKRLKNEE